MFLAVIGVLVAAAYLENNLEAQKQQEQALEIRSRLSEISARIESNIHSNIVSVRGLAAYLSANPAVDDQEFQQIARLFLSNNPMINNLGVSDESYTMVRVYPAEGNQAVLGLNLLDLPAQAVSAREAMNSGQVQFSGPVKLVQGGDAFIVRIPIFDPHSGHVFGLLSFPILLERLYQQVEIPQLSEQYRVSIRHLYEFSTGQVFYGDPALFERDHVVYSVDLPGSRWQLAAAPFDYFESALSARVWVYVLAGLVISVILVIQWLRIRELHSVNLIEKQQMMLDQAQRVGRIGNWSWHIPSNEIFWSDEALRLFGLEKNDQLFKESDYLNFVHTDDLTKVRQVTTHAMNVGGRYQIDFRIVRPDGQMRWVHSEGEVELSAARKPLRVFGTFQDVTSSKRIERQLKQRESQLTAVTDAAQSLIMIVRVSDGVVRFSNPSSKHLLGVDPDQLVGRSFYDFFADAASYEALCDQVSAQGYVRSYQLSLERCDNQQTVIFLAGLQKINFENEACFVVDLVDITETYLANQDLKLAASVFDNTAEAIVVTDSKNSIVSVNPAFTRITGYELADVKGQNPSILSSGRQSGVFYREMWVSLQEYGRWQGEVWNRRRDGELYAEWLSITALKSDDGEIENYVAVFTDITDRKEKEELIQYQANYDALTGIPNRVLFHDRLSRAISSANRQNQRCALMFIDLDRFKEVNDTLGHEAGDELLKEVAARLQKTVRESDSIARLGGDEFTVMIPYFNHINDVGVVAEKIINNLSKVYRLGRNSAHISASVGITVFPDDGSELKRILQNADQAMYAAKSAGRHTYRYFTPEMQIEVEQRQGLQNDMRQGLVNGEFELFFQPIVNSDSLPVKFEALVRWMHPEKGMISPDQFIPLAEETGFIIPLGSWVFQQACRQLALWRKSYPELCMAINLSSKQISTDDSHTEHFIDILHQYDLPSEAVTLEVTESLFLDPTGDSVQKLELLREQGFRIAIDDFGTGYSSLSYLKKLPLSIIKIDKAFVSDLDKAEGDRVLVDAILSIAQSMQLEVVAEGVETQSQADYLREKGTEMYQGWLFSKPLPSSSAEQWLRDKIKA